MKSVCFSAVLFGVLAVFSQTSLAQCDGEAGCGHGHCQTCTGCAPCGSYTFCDYFRAGYCANASWPSQYIPASRRGICDSYAVMINNGWRRQNLLGDYHFEKESHQLTRAGELKVNWILTQAPVEHRNIFVQRAANEDDTARRLANVEDYGETLAPAVQGIDVTDTHIVAEGHRAGSVDNIFVGFQANQPPPVLPASTSSSSSSSSSGQ